MSALSVVNTFFSSTITEVAKCSRGRCQRAPKKGSVEALEFLKTNSESVNAKIKMIKIKRAAMIANFLHHRHQIKGHQVKQLKFFCQETLTKINL